MLFPFSILGKLNFNDSFLMKIIQLLINKPSYIKDTHKTAFIGCDIRCGYYHPLWMWWEVIKICRIFGQGHPASFTVTRLGTCGAVTSLEICTQRDSSNKRTHILMSSLRSKTQSYHSPHQSFGKTNSDRYAPERIEHRFDWQAFRDDSSVGSCQSWMVTGRLRTAEHLGPFWIRDHHSQSNTHPHSQICTAYLLCITYSNHLLLNTVTNVFWFPAHNEKLLFFIIYCSIVAYLVAY